MKTVPKARASQKIDAAHASVDASPSRQQNEAGTPIRELNRCIKQKNKSLTFGEQELLVQKVSSLMQSSTSYQVAEGSPPGRERASQIMAKD